MSVKPSGTYNHCFSYSWLYPIYLRLPLGLKKFRSASREIQKISAAAAAAAAAAGRPRSGKLESGVLTKKKTPDSDFPRLFNLQQKKKKKKKRGSLVGSSNRDLPAAAAAATRSSS